MVIHFLISKVQPLFKSDRRQRTDVMGIETFDQMFY